MAGQRVVSTRNGYAVEIVSRVGLLKRFSPDVFCCTDVICVATLSEVVTAPGSSWQNAYVERVSARSAESVWTTSSSSTSAICVASFHRTWITTTALGHISLD